MSRAARLGSGQCLESLSPLAARCCRAQSSLQMVESEKTRGEYFNLYPLYTSMTGARNGCFSYEFATRKLTTPEIQ